MIIDGRAIATEILKDVETSLNGRRPLVRVIVMQPSAATESYLRIKQARAEEAGMDLQLIRMEDDATTEDIIHKIALGGSDAMLVQLPLPGHIDTAKVLESLPAEQDIDVLSPAAYARFEGNEEGALVPPVAGAVAEILSRSTIDARGKHAVVVGQGKLVGKPSAVLLAQLGAQVTTVTEATENVGEVLKTADIVVSGAGVSNLITPDMVKEGAVLIDAGTTESKGIIVGDMDPMCAEKAGVFTPVPGGVGPISVAMLFRNAALVSIEKPGSA